MYFDMGFSTTHRPPFEFDFRQGAEKLTEYIRHKQQDLVQPLTGSVRS
jgi:hypothetical protein